MPRTTTDREELRDRGLAWPPHSRVADDGGDAIDLLAVRARLWSTLLDGWRRWDAICEQKPVPQAARTATGAEIHDVQAAIAAVDHIISALPPPEPVDDRAVDRGEAIGVVLAKRYRLEKLLAHGSLGCLYEATDLSSGARVAIRAVTSVDDARAARFCELAAHMVGARENALPILAWASEPCCFIAMALVAPPRTLADALVSPISVERAQHIALQILAALKAMPVVHGDLRPCNVFLDERDRVRVTDFGLRHVEADLRSTRVGGVLPAEVMMYATPERLENKHALDVRADVYAVGCMLYTMLAGRAPFAVPEPDQNPLVLAVAVLREEPPPLAHAGFAAVVARAMKKDRAERYQTIEEMADAVITAVEPLPARTSPSRRS